MLHRNKAGRKPVIWLAFRQPKKLRMSPTPFSKRRATMGRFLLIFVSLLIPTMFFAYPPIIEQSDGECTALQQRVIDLASHDDTGRLTVSPLYSPSLSEPSGA